MLKSRIHTSILLSLLLAACGFAFTGQAKAATPAQLTGIATVYNPAASIGPSVGRLGVPVSANGYAVAVLGNSKNTPGWSYPATNDAYVGWLVRLSTVVNSRGDVCYVDVPVVDIGPGISVAPINDPLAKLMTPVKPLPRIVDMLPRVSKLLNNAIEAQGKVKNAVVTMTPLRKLTKAEAARYASGSRTPDNGYSVK